METEQQAEIQQATEDELSNSLSDLNAISDRVELGGASSPADFAAMAYGQCVTGFDLEVVKLSKKGIYRVLNALLKEPIVDVHYKMNGQEALVYGLAQRMRDAKFVMELHVMNERMTEASAEADKEAANEQA